MIAKATLKTRLAADSRWPSTSRFWF